MIDFNQLEHLVAIEKAGTLSKAAELLHISQPGLTRSIQRLEDDLGIKLFEHKKNKLIFNEFGLQAVDYAKTILQQREDMIHNLHTLAIQNTIINLSSIAPAPLWGCSYLLQNNHQYKQINEQLLYDETQLLNSLEENENQLIILSHPVSNYPSYPLFEEQLCLSVPPAHPLALFDSLTFDDMDGQSVLLLNRIGFWSEICQKNIPHSHLLYQEDPEVLRELTKMSSLPNFKSTITAKNKKSLVNRKVIPIISKEAYVQYYLISTKENSSLAKNIASEIKNISWETVLSKR